MRRALPYIAVAIVLIGLLVLAYFFIFASRGASLTTGTNPFGSSGATDIGTGTTQTSAPDSGDNTPTQVAPKLVEITPGPVAKGFIAMNDSGGSTATGSPATPDTEVRYVKRDSGNIYSYLVNAQKITRLSNKTIPGTQTASWLPDGSTAFVQYVSTDEDKTQHIETYALPASGDAGFFLQRDLSEANAVGSTTVFTLLPSTGGSVGSFSKSDGSSVRTAFSSLLAQLTVFTPTTSSIIAETAPSGVSAGYAFTVSSTGAFTQVLGPTYGLEVLPNPSGTALLASSVDSAGMHMVLLDLTTHVVTSLPLATLAEKCVWTRDSSAIYCGVPTTVPNTLLPDAWFQGAVAFTDQIWRMDLTARVANLIVDLPTLTQNPIDAVSLTLDPHAGELVFMNERDGSLWGYSF